MFTPSHPTSPEYKVCLFEYCTSEVPHAPEQRCYAHSKHASLRGSLQPQRLLGTLTTSSGISQGGIPRRKKTNKTWAIFVSHSNCEVCIEFGRKKDLMEMSHRVGCRREMRVELVLKRMVNWLGAV